MCIFVISNDQIGADNDKCMMFSQAVLACLWLTSIVAG